MTTVIIIVGCAAALVGSSFLFYRLGKKGVDAGKALSTANDAVNMVDTAFDTVKPFIPASPAVSIVGKIIDWAKAGTAAAEQLYKTSKIQGDERKAEATDFILNALKIEGITVTPEIQKMIDGAVEGAVKLLPKTNETTFNKQTVNLSKSVTPSEAAQQTKEAVKNFISQNDSTVPTEAQAAAEPQNSAAPVSTDPSATAATEQSATAEPAAQQPEEVAQSATSDSSAAAVTEQSTAAAPDTQQDAADQQRSTAPNATSDSSAAAGTGTADALTAAAKALHTSADMLNNAAIAINGTAAQTDTAATPTQAQA